MNISPLNEPEHLAAAQKGSSEAFAALVEPYRKPLLVHCYRLTGSLEDAEDVVQDTFIRAWHKVSSFLGDGSFRNWLYTIATRLWLDVVRKRKKQVLLPLDGSPADPNSPFTPPTAPAAWLDPLPQTWLASSDISTESAYELKESVSLAFMVALQKLNAHQRVVLILRLVFHWQAKEVAEALGMSVASVNNHLYRARKNLSVYTSEEPPLPNQQLNKFVTAWESGDVNGLIDLLHTKATFAMPPMGVWYAGSGSIRQALQNFVFMPGVEWKLEKTMANGRSAFAIYQRSKQIQPYQAFGLILPIFSGEEGRITEITAFLSPHLIERFGLPIQLD
ncbi:MAG: ECF RNA polymerase sigma factor SigG [Ardenticatenaceae bacterium]|nr:MAG: ECF RNA polymerase sigma factor SigG [Ardenticatenaceae bacterium]